MPELEHERRGQPRIKPKKTTFVEYPDYRPRIRDISLSGAFIVDYRPIARGRVFRLHIVTSKEPPIKAKAMVRRVEPEVGMGVEFIEMSIGDRGRLRDFIGVTAKIEHLEAF